MSGALLAGSVLGGVGYQSLEASGLMPAFIRQGRSIGTIIPDVSIEEINTSRLTVTQHPVANNTPISDHAFMMPQEVVMRCGWSNSNLVAGIVQGAISGGLAGAAQGAVSSVLEQRAQQIFQQLLDLQSSRQPFQLTTGKKTYASMECIELRVTTDHTSEYALMVEAHFQEVLIATVQSTTANPALANQANPASTATTNDAGTKQPAPQPFSLLNGLVNKTGINGVSFFGIQLGTSTGGFGP